MALTYYNTVDNTFLLVLNEILISSTIDAVFCLRDNKKPSLVYYARHITWLWILLNCWSSVLNLYFKLAYNYTLFKSECKSYSSYCVIVLTYYATVDIT